MTDHAVGAQARALPRSPPTTLEDPGSSTYANMMQRDINSMKLLLEKTRLAAELERSRLSLPEAKIGSSFTRFQKKKN